MTALDVKNGMIVSGDKEAKVKMWDIDKKKAWTFEGQHSLMITKVLLWDEYSTFSCSIDKTIRWFDRRDWSDNKG